MSDQDLEDDALLYEIEALDELGDMNGLGVFVDLDYNDEEPVIKNDEQGQIRVKKTKKVKA